MPRGLLADRAPSKSHGLARRRGLIPAVTGLILVGAYAAWAVAVIFFINGLTSPEASARVHLDAGAQGATPGWLADGSASAVFHYGEIYTVSDRLGTRLGLLAVWGTIGLFLMAGARLLRAYTMESLSGLRGARQAWFMCVGASVGAGLVVPFAEWAQASTVLTAAGQPPGLTPVADVGWPWLVLAAVSFVVGRTVPSRIENPDA